MERKPNLGSTPQRIDHWVKLRHPLLTRRQIQEAIESSLVKSDEGNRLVKGDRLSEDNLDYSGLEAHLATLRKGTPNPDIAIIAEKPDYVIVDKPAGVPTHPISLFDTNTLTHWALATYPDLVNEFSDIQPTVTPHRLDTGTSGLVIVAKNKAGYERWRIAFSEKRVEKLYLAWCWGKPRKPEYEVAAPMAHDLRDNRKMVIVQDKYRPPIQHSHSYIKVLKKNKDHFLCAVDCQTGVTHQVRIHLAHLGFPLIGDTLYDIQTAARSFSPAHFLLRAVEIKTKEEAFQLVDKAFEKSPTKD